ncbi:MAG: F0F1 ATP synthase subunit A [bacterium]|nr:F0F1 ATP synthase subunit A [bacterium]
MSANSLHISISAEPIAQVGGLIISNSIFTSLIASALLIGLAFLISSRLKASGKPGRLQSMAEMVIEALYGLIYGVTVSKKKARHFFPIIATFFLFILFNNWLGLFPGVGTVGYTATESEEHAVLTPSQIELSSSKVIAAETAIENDETVLLDSNLEVTSNETQDKKSKEIFIPYLRAGTADLNTTIALALISVVMTQVMGVSYLSLGYFKKFLNFSSPIMFFVGFLEFISEIGKILSFAFRLFGNIFAGEVLLAVIAFLVPVIIPMPFYGLEIFVGLIQALVFALLTTVFFNMATLSHEGDH